MGSILSQNEPSEKPGTIQSVYVRRKVDKVYKPSNVGVSMSPTNQKTFTFVLPAELKNVLRAIRERDGIAEAEQIRRGIQMWIESKGVKVKTERPRAVTRKRS